MYTHSLFAILTYSHLSLPPSFSLSCPEEIANKTHSITIRFCSLGKKTNERQQQICSTFSSSLHIMRIVNCCGNSVRVILQIANLCKCQRITGILETMVRRIHLKDTKKLAMKGLGRFKTNPGHCSILSSSLLKQKNDWLFRSEEPFCKSTLLVQHLAHMVSKKTSSFVAGKVSSWRTAFVHFLSRKAISSLGFSGPNAFLASQIGVRGQETS